MISFLSQKKIGTIIIFIFALMFVATKSHACELYLSQSENSLIINTSNQCLPLGYENAPKFAGTKAEKITDLKTKYNWPKATIEQQAKCDTGKLAANAKVWKVAVNPRYPTKPTRPTKFVIAVGSIRSLGVTTKIRAKIGSECGIKVKGINKRYEWREITINSKKYAAVCE